MEEQNTQMPEVNIAFEVSYLPVIIGGVRIRFINTEENLVRLAELGKDPERYVKEKAKDLLPEFDRLQERVDESNAKWEDVAEMLDLQRRAFGLVFDEIFESGDFDRLYAKNQDLRQLIALMPTIMEVIGKANGRAMELKDMEFERKAKKLLAKKAGKRRHKR